MRRIQSAIDSSSADFIRHHRHNRQLAERLRNDHRVVRFDRPPRSMGRLEKQKKLFVRERLELLLDPDTPFLELSTLAANGAYEEPTPGAGLVAGIGSVSGREVMVIAGDATVKGGAWYPLSVKKTVRALDIAIENRLPVVHLVDSAGGYLPLQSELFADKYMGGRVFRNQCKLNAMGVEQVALALGHCTAGGAYVPTLCDVSIIVRGTGGVFLGGPPLVKAATGEDVSADELGGATMHSSVSGTADHAVGSEEEGLALVREVVATFRQKEKAVADRRDPEPPLYDPDELYGIVPDDVRTQFDMHEIIARLVDGSRFHEFRPDYGSTAVCGLAYWWGFKVGIVANNGVLFSDSAKKCTQFMMACDRDRVPVVFLQNITGFMIGKEYERGGITKDGAKMLMVQANLGVPKFTLIVNGSFGAGNYAMCGRAYDARFLFSWPNAQISVMGAEQATKTLTQIRVAALRREGREPGEDELSDIAQRVSADYAERSGAYYATSQLWDDGILDPVDTRNAIAVALSASLNAEFECGRYGILRI